MVTKDVQENSVMVGIPAKNVGQTNKDEKFTPYGIDPSGNTKEDK